MDPKIRDGIEVGSHQAVRREGALHAVAAVAALVAGGPLPEDAEDNRERPWWERHKVRGNHRPRKGTKPKPKKFFLVQEVPPGQVEVRQAAGQRLVRRADGIWVWPVSDQRRYQEEHP